MWSSKADACTWDASTAIMHLQPSELLQYSISPHISLRDGVPEFCLGWGGTIIDWARPRAHHLGFRVSQGERPYREPHTEASALMCLPYFQMVSNCFSSSLGFPTQRRFVSAIAEEAQTGELMVELQQSDLQCLLMQLHSSPLCLQR